MLDKADTVGGEEQGAVDSPAGRRLRLIGVLKHDVVRLDWAERDASRRLLSAIEGNSETREAYQQWISARERLTTAQAKLDVVEAGWRARREGERVVATPFQVTDAIGKALTRRAGASGAGEADLPGVFARPIAAVVDALSKTSHWHPDDTHLPDIEPEHWQVADAEWHTPAA